MKRANIGVGGHQIFGFKGGRDQIKTTCLENMAFLIIFVVTNPYSCSFYLLLHMIVHASQIHSSLDVASAVA